MSKDFDICFFLKKNCLLIAPRTQRVKGQSEEAAAGGGVYVGNVNEI